MKTHIALLAAIPALLICETSFAITYVRSNPDGSIAAISESDFNRCKEIIYRSAAKEQLPLEHRKILLKKLIQGETVNNPDVIRHLLKQKPGTCSYSEAPGEFQ